MTCFYFRMRRVARLQREGRKLLEICRMVFKFNFPLTCTSARNIDWFRWNHRWNRQPDSTTDGRRWKITNRNTSHVCCCGYVCVLFWFYFLSHPRTLIHIDWKFWNQKIDIKPHTPTTLVWDPVSFAVKQCALFLFYVHIHLLGVQHGGNLFL